MEPVLWSAGATTAEPTCPRACAQPQEKPPQREAHAAQHRTAPLAAAREKAQHSKPINKVTKKEETSPSYSRLLGALQAIQLQHACFTVLEHATYFHTRRQTCPSIRLLIFSRPSLLGAQAHQVLSVSNHCCPLLQAPLHSHHRQRPIRSSGEGVHAFHTRVL